MISSKTLAKKLIHLLESGADPKRVAHSLVSASHNSGFQDVLRNTLPYLEKYSRQEKERNALVVEVTKLNPSPLASDVLTPFYKDGVFMKENKDILAGARLRKGDLFFDGSVKGRLDNLRKSFT